VQLIKDHFRYLTTQGKYPGVDLLRAAAVSMVFLYHLCGLRFGWMGLDLFFVISGFLIGGKVYDAIRQGSLNLSRYYAHRSLRILPYYYFIVVVWATILPMSHSYELPSPNLIASTMLSEFAVVQTTAAFYFGWPVYTPMLAGGSWSLCVEEAFYLLMPGVLYVIYKCCKGRTPLILASLLVLGVLAIPLRFYTLNLQPNNANWIWATYTQFPSRIDQLAAGVIAAVLLRHLPLAKPAKFFMTLWGLALFATFAASDFGSAAVGAFSRVIIWTPSILAIAFAMICLGIATVPRIPKFVVFIARLSYTIYLGHLFIAYLFPGQFVLSIAGLPCLLAVFGFSYLASLLVEYPFIRLYKGKNAALTDLKGLGKPRATAIPESNVESPDQVSVL
jgi:peptidoglycan/LPS O-acetylase OafA/YrhL